MGISGSPLPTSDRAYRGIELLDVALEMGLLPTDVKSETVEGRLEITVQFVAGYKYYLFAHTLGANDQREVAYYVAFNRRNNRAEYAIGPDRVGDFIDNAKTLIWAASLFYGIRTRASSASIQIVVAVRHGVAGRPMQALKANMRAVASMWKDPMAVLGAVTEVGAIGAVGRFKPKVRTKQPTQTKMLPPKLPPRIPSNVKIVSPVYRLAGRDIVVVEASVGRKAFYRSSGSNSGQPGKWFPVDEFYLMNGWFNKKQYVKGPLQDKNHPLHRLGTPELAKISENLNRTKIPKGIDIPKGLFENEFATANRIFDFFGVKLPIESTFRPMRDFGGPFHLFGQISKKLPPNQK